MARVFLLFFFALLSLLSSTDSFRAQCSKDSDCLLYGVSNAVCTNASVMYSMGELKFPGKRMECHCSKTSICSTTGAVCEDVPVVIYSWPTVYGAEAACRCPSGGLEFPLSQPRYCLNPGFSDWFKHSVPQLGFMSELIEKTPAVLESFMWTYLSIMKDGGKLCDWMSCSNRAKMCSDINVFTKLMSAPRVNKMNMTDLQTLTCKVLSINLTQLYMDLTRDTRMVKDLFKMLMNMDTVTHVELETIADNMKTFVIHAMAFFADPKKFEDKLGLTLPQQSVFDKLFSYTGPFNKEFNKIVVNTFSDLKSDNLLKWLTSLGQCEQMREFVSKGHDSLRHAMFMMNKVLEFTSSEDIIGNFKKLPQMKKVMDMMDKLPHIVSAFGQLSLSNPQKMHDMLDKVLDALFSDSKDMCTDTSFLDGYLTIEGGTKMKDILDLFCKDLVYGALWRELGLHKVMDELKMWLMTPSYAYPVRFEPPKLLEDIRTFVGMFDSLGQIGRKRYIEPLLANGTLWGTALAKVDPYARVFGNLSLLQDNLKKMLVYVRLPIPNTLTAEQNVAFLNVHDVVILVKELLKGLGGSLNYLSTVFANTVEMKKIVDLLTQQLPTVFEKAALVAVDHVKLAKFTKALQDDDACVQSSDLHSVIGDNPLTQLVCGLDTAKLETELAGLAANDKMVKALYQLTFQKYDGQTFDETAFLEELRESVDLDKPVMQLIGAIGAPQSPLKAWFNATVWMQAIGAVSAKANSACVGTDHVIDCVFRFVKASLPGIRWKMLNNVTVAMAAAFREVDKFMIESVLKPVDNMIQGIREPCVKRDCSSLSLYYDEPKDQWLLLKKSVPELKGQVRVVQGVPYIQVMYPSLVLDQPEFPSFKNITKWIKLSHYMRRMRLDSNGNMVAGYMDGSSTLGDCATKSITYSCGTPSQCVQSKPFVFYTERVDVFVDVVKAFDSSLLNKDLFPHVQMCHLMRQSLLKAMQDSNLNAWIDYNCEITKINDNLVRVTYGGIFNKLGEQKIKEQLNKMSSLSKFGEFQVKNISYAYSSEVCTSTNSIEPGKKDCAGVCNGEAVVNDCGLCVLGTTGRSMDFGKACGSCRNSPNYGKGDGARLDTCAKQCVGGATGLSLNHFGYLRDCANVCNGTRKNDTCGKCEKTIEDTTKFPYGSRLKDCAGTCHPDYRSLLNGAQNNSRTCYKCVGGKSPLKMSDVRDVCGMCGGNGSSCKDCDGVPNGGKQKDACGVCGGDGSSCTAVVSVFPLAVPAGVKQEFMVIGGGFDADSKCVFTPSDGAQATEVAGTPDSKRKLKCEATLVAGVYELTVKFGSSYKSATDKTKTTILAYSSGIVYKRVDSIDEYTISCGEKNTVKVEIEFAKETAPPTGCLIELENGRKLSMSGSVKTKVLTCSVPDVSKSQKVTVFFIYADRKPVGSGLEYTVYCKAPTILSVTLKSDCRLAIVSDLPIDRTNLESCSKGIETALASDVKCSFVSKNVVTIENSILKPGDSLKFRANVLKHAGQKYSKAMAAKTVVVSGDSFQEVPVVKISGSATIAQCPGSKLRMTAQVPKGSICRPLQYTWTVSSVDDTNVTDIQAVLDGEKKSRVKLDASLTSEDATYTFTVTVTNVFNKSASAQHVAKADSGQTPIITSMASNPENPSYNDRIRIESTIRKPSCAKFGRVTYTWSSSPARSGVDLCRRHICSLKKRSLPAGSTTVFTLTIEASGTTPIIQSVTVTVQSLPLKAVIQGLKKRRVGIDDGIIEFSGEESSDPNGYSDDMTYLWECSAIDDSDQYLASIALDPTSSRTAKLSLDPSSFIAGRYQLSLTVAKDAQGLSSTKSIIMTMVAGKPPRIRPRGVIRTGEVSVRAGKQLFGRFLISSRSPVLRSGIVYSLDTGADYATFDISKVEITEFIEKSTTNSQEKKYRCVLKIAKDALQSGGTYKINIAVTNTANESADAGVIVKVKQSIVGCIFEGPTVVTELDKVDLFVHSCQASDGSLLQYRFCEIDKDTGRRKFVSGWQLSNTFSKIVSLKTKSFCVKAAGATDDPQLVIGDQLTITPKSDISETEKDEVLSEVDDYVQVGDYSSAMVSLEPLTDLLKSKGKNLRRKRAVPITPPDSTASIPQKKLEVVAASHNTGSYDEAESLIMIDALVNIDLSSTNSSDQASMITYLNSYVAVLASGDGVDSNTYSTVMDLINRLRSYSGSNKVSLNEVEKNIIKALSKTLDYGSAATVVNGNKYTMTAAFRDLTSGMKSSASKPVRVNFGTELENRYTDWDCGNQFTSCFGVKVSLTQYETSMDPKSTRQSDVDNRVADIVELVLSHPLTGEALVIVNLGTEVEIEMPRSRTPASTVGMVTCKFWDQVASAWSSQGVTTVSVNDTSVTCKTTHLSTFTVIVEEPPTTQGPSTAATPDSTGSGKTTPAPSGLSTTTIIIIAAVSGGVVLLILVVIIIVCVCTRKNKVDRSTPWNDSHAMTDNPGRSWTKNEQI